MPAPAAEWRLEAATGTAWSLPSGLDVEQAGAPAPHVDADWETRPFEGAPFYAWRVGRWDGEAGPAVV